MQCCDNMRRNNTIITLKFITVKHSVDYLSPEAYRYSCRSCVTNSIRSPDKMPENEKTDKVPEFKMDDNPYPNPYARPHPNRYRSSSVPLSLSTHTPSLYLPISIHTYTLCLSIHWHSLSLCLSLSH